MPRRTRRGADDPEVTERRGNRTEQKEVDESNALPESAAGAGADLDEGDLEFFEEQSEDED